MSHSKHRAEKNCLNCGTEVIENYCSHCGQENTEANISFWHLVTHFFNDITHFDGKFFSTLKKLITKPGFLSLAFVEGKRMRYLDPVRMYIFTSFLFFLLFFSFSKIDNLDENIIYGHKNLAEISKMDSTSFSDFSKQFNDGKPMTKEEFEIFTAKKNSAIVFDSNKKYNSLENFDSLNLKGEIEGNYLERGLLRKQLEIKIKYNDNQNAYLKALWQSISHSLPQLLFISLPLFALILKLLYIRHKQTYYTQHIIYAIHLYIFTFIILFGYMLKSWLAPYIGSVMGGLFIFGITVWLFIYEYKAMRRFYGQGRGKTIIKFLLANFLRFMIILILFVFITLISFYKS